MYFWTIRDRVKPWKKYAARYNRQHPTETERLLWQELKGKKLTCKFRRQAILLGYIADFYCPASRAVIELDGLYHQNPKQKAWDYERDRALAWKGIRVIRIDASRVLSDLPGVLEEIQSFVSLPRL